MKLGLIAEFVMGQAPHSSTYNSSGEGSLLIKAGDFGDYLPTPTEYTTNPISFSRKGDVLICVVGATSGKVNLGIDASITRSIAAIRPDPNKLNSQFLFFYLRFFYPRLNKLSSGSAQGIISKPVLADIDIPDISLKDQYKIATLLIKSYELLKQRKDSIVMLDRLVKNSFLKMFGNPTYNPKKFKIGTIRELVTEVKYGTSKVSETEGKLPYLRMNNITTDGYWDFKSIKYININESEKEKYIIKKGDLIFNRTNSKELVGKTAVYTDDKEMVIAGYLIRVRTNKKANPWYIWGYLNSSHGKQTLFGLSKSIVGMANINAQELQDISILVPPVKLQNEFAAVVEKIDILKTALLNSQKEISNLLAALCQKAFKGQLDLSAMIVLEEEEHFASANDRTEDWQFNRPKSVKVYKKAEGKKNEKDKGDKQYSNSYAFDEAAGKKARKSINKQSKVVQSSQVLKKEKITWENVSSHQVADWIKDKYTGYHFSPEMLMNYLANEHVVFPAYYSSEELKKYPHLNGAEDIKSFVFTAVRNIKTDEETERAANPFIKLEQQFYDAEKENFQLKVTDEDYELLRARDKRSRSGIYFSIVEE